jgi:hypothetical protein
MPDTQPDAPPDLSPEQQERLKQMPVLEGAPDGVRRSAVGAKVTPEQERSALTWFLEPQRPLRYRVPVQYDTPEGVQTLTLLMRSIPQHDMERIEQRNRKGDGPLAEYDDFQVNAEMVGEALVAFVDGEEEIVANDPRVLSGLPSVAEAMKARFYYQPGLLAGLASEVRRISGWGTDRVGRAERVLTATAGNS